MHASLDFDSAVAQLDNFDTIIDTRSPGEFAEDHIPGAINCPVLDDAQREEVGTIYKNVSPFDAKKIGAAYAAKNIAKHIEERFLDKPKNWRSLIYCWRGGNRSGSMSHIFAKIGWPVVQLAGGYKSYRRHVIDALEDMPATFRFEVVCGLTGTGKTRFLQQLAAAGEQVLDLEHLACHRGSVLGPYIAEPQPSQRMFESALWHSLRGFDSDRVIYCESESKKVGNVRVPEKLMDRIRQSPCIVIDLPKEERVKLLTEEYWHFVRDHGLLAEKLAKLIPLFGRATIEHWNALAESGNVNQLVSDLLDRHYDPAYSASIARNFKQLDSARRVDIPNCNEAAYKHAVERLLTSD